LVNHDDDEFQPEKTAIECCHLKASTNAISTEIVNCKKNTLHLVSVKLVSEKAKQQCLTMSLAYQESMISQVVQCAC